MKSQKFKVILITIALLLTTKSALAISGSLTDIKNYKNSEINLKNLNTNLKIFLVKTDETQDRIEKNFSNIKEFNGKTYVPLRELSEILGKSVIFWNNEIKMPVLILEDGSEINMPIDKNIFIIDKKVIETKSPATIDSEKTYVPLREIAELMGYRVEYQSEFKTIILTEK